MQKNMRWLAAGALCAALGWGRAQAATAKKADESKQPVAAKEVSGLPRVLIIGDSISLGYTPFVAQQLKGKANIIHAPGNNESTARGLEHLDAWLGPKKWDVIHFNWGLHDLKWIDDKTKIAEVGFRIVDVLDDLNVLEVRIRTEVDAKCDAHDLAVELGVVEKQMGFVEEFLEDTCHVFTRNVDALLMIDGNV